MARRNSILVSKSLYQMGVMTLMVAFTWVVFGVYTALNEHVNADIDKKILEPINPVLDREVIISLSQRLVVEPSQITEPSTSVTIEEGEPQ